MIISRLLLLPMFFMFVQCMSFSGPDPVDSIASKTAKLIGDKYNLEPCALGGSAKEGKTSVIIVDFEYRGSAIDFVKGRKMIIDLVKGYLTEFNQQVDPNNIYCYPFDIKNVNIAIYCKDPFGGNYKSPYISIIMAGSNKISFFIDDPNDPFKINQFIDEPYEEALKKIKESTP